MQQQCCEEAEAEHHQGYSLALSATKPALSGTMWRYMALS
jgi:hypothetical protein